MCSQTHGQQIKHVKDCIDSYCRPKGLADLEVQACWCKSDRGHEPLRKSSQQYTLLQPHTHIPITIDYGP